MIGGQARQIGVVGGQIDHILVRKMLGERRHDRIDARARLKVLELLIDHAGVLARQIGESARLTPVGP